MNLDLSIFRMAANESDSLIVRQALIARKRSELEVQMALTQVSGGDNAAGASLDSALTDMQNKSEALVSDTKRLVDKTA